MQCILPTFVPTFLIPQLLLPKSLFHILTFLTILLCKSLGLTRNVLVTMSLECLLESAELISRCTTENRGLPLFLTCSNSQIFNNYENKPNKEKYLSPF